VDLLDLIDVAVNASDIQEREDDLVSLEQTARHVSVDHASDVIDQDLETLLHDLRLGALLDGGVEETLDVT